MMGIVPRLSARPIWRPTASHIRASLAAVVLALVAVLARRADLLVLASPVAIIGAWSMVTRPPGPPEVTARLADPALREGEATTWRATVTDAGGIDTLVAVMPHASWIVARPVSRVVSTHVDADADTADLALAIRSTRWGRHEVPHVTIVASSAWGAFVWSDRTSVLSLISLPLPSTFDSSAAIRRTSGLVGLDRSSRAGDGTDFAGIRAFQSGDRMRRINWPRSMRAGSLHVTSTWADQDTLVVLEVDATDDIGISGGVDGRASSLDSAVRAAGAIAEHHVQRGDRVTLRVFGSSSARTVPAASGRNQLRRILDELSGVRGGSDPSGFRTRGHLLAPADSLLILFSPLVSVAPLDRAVALARRGVAVVVVDTLPEHVTDDEDPLTTLAWRIRLLERNREVRRAEELGVAVVAWRGPGSLDQFLRDVSRRASAPRMATR